jgi:hypothetical protein
MMENIHLIKAEDKYETNEISKNIDHWRALRDRARPCAGTGVHHNDNRGSSDRHDHDRDDFNGRHNCSLHARFGLYYVPNDTGRGPSTVLLYEGHEHC